MAGKPVGLSQATADRCAQAGPILHPTTPRRRRHNLFNLLAVLAVVLLAVALSWAAADLVRP